MAKSLSLFFFLFVSLVLTPAQSVRGVPMFFERGDEYEEVIKETPLFTFHGKDSLPQHSLSLLSDSMGNPLLFYADIYTPVCIDNVCKPVQIEIYWNLIGNYVGFALQPEQPLTKFDHEVFEPEDYAKFHRLMLDKHSVLGRSTLEDLFDSSADPKAEREQIVYNGVEVDAVSEPTKKHIRESTVEGALYSCYTLWHLVNGEIRGKMEAYLLSRYTPELANQLLNSQDRDYQLFALKQLQPDEFNLHLHKILEIFRAGSPLTRSYLLKKMPKTDWASDTLVRYLYGAFSTWDMNSQTLLLNNLAHASPHAVLLLSRQIYSMKKNQLRLYLEYLEKEPGLLTNEVRTELREQVQSGEYVYAYLIADFLINE